MTSVSSSAIIFCRYHLGNRERYATAWGSGYLIAISTWDFCKPSKSNLNRIHSRSICVVYFYKKNLPYLSARQNYIQKIVNPSSESSQLPSQGFLPFPRSISWFYLLNLIFLSKNIHKNRTEATKFLRKNRKNIVSESVLLFPQVSRSLNGYDVIAIGSRLQLLRR